MTLLERRPVRPVEPRRPDVGLVGWLTTTDHKRIGLLYGVTALFFFVVGGVLALLMRSELAQPGLQLMDRSTYNEVFTMHGSIMMFLFLGPFAFGLANYLVPLQVGAPDVAFPRLNALSYWLFLGGGLTMMAGFLTARGAANFGWFSYAPLSNGAYSPGTGNDLWLIGVILTGTGTILGGVNIITTVITLRAPGMTMFRMPIFTWNLLVVSVMVILVFPVLTAGLAMLFADRKFGGHFFEYPGGSPILYQHLFWFFGHPEVYIVALPFFGVATEIIPVFSRKPLFGYKGFVLATLAIASLSTAVWAHHMFATGAILLAFFSGMSLLIAVPTGIKFFNWIGTMWRGQLSFESPMLFCIGFLVVFLLGGLTGPMLASAPFDFEATDTYFVVAHMHHVLFGTAAFGMFGGVYFWFPKVTGRMPSERLARWHFWLMLVGFNVAFFPQHLLGLRGMPRRIADYDPHLGWSFLNLVSTVGAFLIAASILPFLWNMAVSARHGRPAGDDPWGGYSLEWATTSPPPPHNFDRLPPIRSERPVFDLHHPELVPGASAGRHRTATS
jgi:cytochrome c oxidase subunit I